MQSAVLECSACGVQCSACSVQSILICVLQPDVCVYTISSEYRFIAIMSDGAAPVHCIYIDRSVSLYPGVWENVAAAHIAKHVVLADSLPSAAKEIVKDAGEQSVAADRGCV